MQVPELGPERALVPGRAPEPVLEQGPEEAVAVPRAPVLVVEEVVAAEAVEAAAVPPGPEGQGPEPPCLTSGETPRDGSFPGPPP